MSFPAGPGDNFRSPGPFLGPGDSATGTQSDMSAIPPPQSYGGPLRGRGGGRVSRAIRGNRGRGAALRGGAGAGGMHMGLPVLTPADILGWLDNAPPFALKRVLKHIRWLLDQYGESEEEQEGEAEAQQAGAGPFAASVLGAEPSGDMNNSVCDSEDLFAEEVNATHMNRGNLGDAEPTKVPNAALPTPPKKPKFANTLGGTSGPMQWTPNGWVVKDNSHKVTSRSKATGPVNILPAVSEKYPEAGADREKLRILQNNLVMMQLELNKICKWARIMSFDIEQISNYPAEHQEKLRAAHNCVSAAQKTVDEYVEYLVQDKYKVWNDEQKQEQMKSMIGEMPTGVPFKKPEPEPEPESANPPQNDDGSHGDTDDDHKNHTGSVGENQESPQKSE